MSIHIIQNTIIIFFYFMSISANHNYTIIYMVLTKRASINYIPSTYIYALTDY